MANRIPKDDRPDPDDLTALGMTEEAFTAMVDRATQRAEADTAPKAIAARYDRDSGRIVVDLDNDTTFIFPARYGQGLAEATDEQLAEVTVWPHGLGLHWASLDADLAIDSLLQGLFGSPGWMRRLAEARGRKGGSVTSEAKASAARENGRKGGRPRKRQA